MNDKSLPIWASMPRVIESLVKKRNVVIVAPTGSGKTTQVPQAVLDNGLAGRGAILVVEPRRVACRAVARRVASERGESTGGAIGFIVRYDGQFSAATRLCYVTDGVLMRFLERDRQLRDVGVVVFDEFHERRMLSDIALGLLKLAQAKRNDLRLVVMSATMDAGRVAAYLDADVVTAEGRAFPVAVAHLTSRPSESELCRLTASIVYDLHATRPPGDILAFLPGKREIFQVKKALDRSGVTGATVLPLYGELERDAQDAVFGPVAGRKIVLATNIAETSLTIPGVTIVVDSGLERRASYNYATAMAAIALERICATSAEQRAGRAGRTRPGECVRMWSAEEHAHLEPAIPPEVQRTDVASAVLTLRSAGVRDMSAFPFLDAPSPERLASAERLLAMLGAFDAQGVMTKIGVNMLRLPLSPRCARMIIEAERSRCLNEIATVTALLSGRPLFVRPPGEAGEAKDSQRVLARDDSSDFFTVIEVYRRWRANRYHPGWCQENYVSYEALAEARNLRRKILDVCFRRGSVWNKEDAPRHVVRRCIASGLVDRVARKLEGTRYEFCSGPVAERDDGSVVSADMIVAADIHVIEGAKGRKERTVFSLATAITRDMLEQLATPGFSREREVLAFFPATGTARIRERLRYGKLQFESAERFVGWTEAWSISREVEKKAELGGMRKIDVRAEPRGMFSTMVGRSKAYVDANGAGTYWAVIGGTPERPRVTLHAKAVDVPPPDKSAVAASTLIERLSALSGAVAKLAK